MLPNIIEHWIWISPDEDVFHNISIWPKLPIGTVD